MGRDNTTLLYMVLHIAVPQMLITLYIYYHIYVYIYIDKGKHFSCTRTPGAVNRRWPQQNPEANHTI